MYKSFISFPSFKALMRYKTDSLKTQVNKKQWITAKVKKINKNHESRNDLLKKENIHVKKEYYLF